MKLKIEINKMYVSANKKFKEQFGFSLQEISFDQIINYLHNPKDSSSLAVTRILFGICMLFDIPDERGGAIMRERWGNPNTCHFPLIPLITAIPMPYMAIVYLALWLGAVGISLGYRFRLSSWTFTICYWYLFLIEKSYWNNHSYLFGLVALLLSCSQANCYWSIDAYLDPTLKKTTVPYWNYFILKYQIFILYFMAGMKKGTAEWLTGYSVQNLSEHWVFFPFKLILTVPQIDYIIVHWFIFIFDLTIAVWMMWSKTRNIAMIFCALFHLMNSRLFAIGMFPWVCLATMPLYYPFDWPKKVFRLLSWSVIPKQLNHYIHLLYFVSIKQKNLSETHKEMRNNKTESEGNKSDKGDSLDVFNNRDITEKTNEFEEKNISSDMQTYESIAEEKTENCYEEGYKRNVVTCALILFYVGSQAFLPYSHFITKGYNNWSNGLYGYSWDMMVHTWDIYSVVVKVVDNENNEEYFTDPYIYTPNDRWTRHGDMVYQYAHCLRDRLFQPRSGRRHSQARLSENISIYIDVWYSLNGRFTQRMFTKSDLLKTTWSPFKRSPFLLPLLDEGYSWRSRLQSIRVDVHSWNNYSDVIFIAEFPGYEQEKFIPHDLTNVSLTVLQGAVVYEPELTSDFTGQSLRLSKGHTIQLDSERFHKVSNIDSVPVFYMYTFGNLTEANKEEPSKPSLPIDKEIAKRLKNIVKFIHNIFSNIFTLSQCQ